jgi:hypothetical protein
MSFIFDKSKIIVWPVKVLGLHTECFSFDLPQTAFREKLLPIVLVNIPDKIRFQPIFPACFHNLVTYSDEICVKFNCAFCASQATG